VIIGVSFRMSRLVSTASISKFRASKGDLRI
jgi:hypothetical protein